MRKVEEEILKALEKEGLTAPQIAKKTGHSLSYVYETLYRLELKNLVCREWQGAWVWRAKK